MALIYQITSVICYILGIGSAVYLMLRLYVATPLVIMQKANPWAAIKHSFSATKHHVLALFVLIIANILIFMISLIPLGIGLIWSLPYLLISYGVIYERLVSSQSTA